MNKKFIYIASRYKYETEIQHRQFRAETAECAQEIFIREYIPIAPTLISYDWEKTLPFKNKDLDYWLFEFCFPLIDKCDGLFVCNGLYKSVGVNREVEYAITKGMPIIHRLTDL